MTVVCSARRAGDSNSSNTSHDAEERGNDGINMQAVARPALVDRWESAGGKKAGGASADNAPTAGKGEGCRDTRSRSPSRHTV